MWLSFEFNEPKNGMPQTSIKFYHLLLVCVAIAAFSRSMLQRLKQSIIVSVSKWSTPVSSIVETCYPHGEETEKSEPSALVSAFPVTCGSVSRREQRKFSICCQVCFNCMF